jgi:glucan 1,3-beta-glucosidase
MASSSPAMSMGGPGIHENSPEIRELNPPQATFALGSHTPSALTVDSTPGTPNPTNSAPLLSEQDRMQSWQHQHAYAPHKPSRKRPILFLLAALVGIGLVVVAVVVPVFFTVIKPKQHHSTAAAAAAAASPGSASGSGGSSGDGNGGGSTTSPANLATSGGDGSTVTTADGTTFTYRNQFGGFCEF